METHRKGSNIDPLDKGAPLSVPSIIPAGGPSHITASSSHTTQGGMRSLFCPLACPIIPNAMEVLTKWEMYMNLDNAQRQVPSTANQNSTCTTSFSVAFELDRRTTALRAAWFQRSQAQRFAESRAECTSEREG